MRNTILPVTVLLAFFSCKGPDNQQEATVTNVDTVKQAARAEVPVNYDYTYPRNILPARPGDDLGFDFYPIGFSPDGHLAYIYRSCSDGCGCCSQKLIIQSLNTDKTVAELGLEGSKNEDDQVDHLASWNNELRTVKGKLFSFGISQSDLTLEKSRTLKDAIGLRQYEISIRTEEIMEYSQMVGNDAPALNYEILVTMSGGKTKRVGSGKFGISRGFEYLGYIRSPFKDQIAIVLNKQILGWEAGRENEVFVVGCSLDPTDF